MSGRNQRAHLTWVPIFTRGGLERNRRPCRVTVQRIIRKVVRDDPNGHVEDVGGLSFFSHWIPFGLTPDEYRDRYGLPSTYPIVAPAYSAARSEMAKAIGLGAKGRKSKSDATAPAKARTSLPSSVSSGIIFRTI